MKIKNYLIHIPKKTNYNTNMIILLHGYGSNEFDLFYLKKEFPNSMLIVSIQGPISLGPQSFAWYEFDLINKINNIKQAQSSRLLIMKLIDSLSKKYIFNINNIWLCGFSQGAILAYSLLINYPDFFKKGVLLSGYLEFDIIGKIKKNSKYKNLELFISHGIEDNIIPITWVRESYKILKKLNIKITYQEYSSGHILNNKNHTDMINWIQQKNSIYN